MKKTTVIIFSFLICSVSFAQFDPNWESLDKRETPNWWSDAKFGIFIHWGLYSVPAYAPVDDVEGIYEKYAEHYYNRLLNDNKLFSDFHNRHYGENFNYSDFASMFKAEHLNTDDWAELFNNAGAKYVVLTSKHHDGFCLWPSTYSPYWNSVFMGPNLDIIGTLSQSVKDAGLRFGIYYSLLEWENPLYKESSISEWVDDYMIPQMKELVNSYRPEIIFSDGEWDYDSKTFKSEQFLAWLYNDSPVKNSVVVNDRWGKETRSKHGGYYTTEYDIVRNNEGIGENASHPWEESRGMGTSYGYNRFEKPHHYLTSKELIDILIDKVSNGGNFLLNVGPDANGLIPAIMQERLLDMGKWLKINGESIYSSRPWLSNNKPHIKDIAFTLRDRNLYVILKEWQNDSIVIENVQSYANVQLLGFEGQIQSTLQNGRLIISPPKLTINDMPCEHAWVFKVENFKE